jgi:serine/threonine-protein kinase
MAYVSDESGRREVYIRTLSGAPHRVQVSSDGGDEPVWSRHGSEIFYRRGIQMFAVPVTTGSAVTLGQPAVLFEGRYDVDPFNGDATNYDVFPDGQRFVMVRPTDDNARSLLQLSVVVNWYEELKRLVPPR